MYSIGRLGVFLQKFSREMEKMIKFTKMQGAGNDYIYVNTMECEIPSPETAAREWSRPHTGIGSDGLVLIGRSEKADFSMRIFNADGSEAMMCGNASRCVGKYLYENGLARKTEIRLETLSGIRTLFLNVNDGKVESVCVDMGIASGFRELHGIGIYRRDGLALSTGNPHFVIFTDDADSIDLEKEGPVLENDKAFPDRTNVEFATVLENGRIRMRVWERGSGITEACGTGACATASAALYRGLAGNSTEIIMDGGSLSISITPEKHILMTGPAVKVFEGTVEYGL